LKRLLDNAIKFTREGAVTLAVDCYEYTDKNHQDMINLVFTVSDTGTGIAEDRLQDIFQVYNIDDNRKSGFNAGNGIGLAIAKGYTDLLDGELQVDSVYGGGSVFTFSLNQVTVTKNGRNRMVSRIDEMVSKEDADKLWLPDVNLLIVDDDEQSLEITKKQLAKFEMKIDTASSGINAIDMIMNNSYDVVFMALSLPIMNGTEAMKEIRELDGENFATLPIISMDTNAIDKNRDSLLETGFTDTLVKPIDVRRAAAILKDCLPQSKIHERADSISEYIQGSRYRDGLIRLKEYVDVESALEKIGGSIDVFNRLVLNYYNQNHDAPQEISGKFPKNIRAFKNKVHNVKTGSNNIGAYKLSQEASRIEAAINIGNKDYTRDNLEEFIRHLTENLEVIGAYVSFANEISGMTDEEYADRFNMTGEDGDSEETAVVTVDISILEDIKYAALDNDFQTVLEYMNILQGVEYTGEDKEFMDVLEDAVLGENVADIDQLVTTYIDLKQP
jgi:CheY-like chemotaxis protein